MLLLLIKFENNSLLARFSLRSYLVKSRIKCQKMEPRIFEHPKALIDFIYISIRYLLCWLTSSTKVKLHLFYHLFFSHVAIQEDIAQISDNQTRFIKSLIRKCMMLAPLLKQVVIKSHNYFTYTYDIYEQLRD